MAAKRLVTKTYRHFMKDSLYRNSMFLMANTAALGIFSFLFWMLAARTYPTADVGVISAVVSISTLLASLSFFGFDYALIKFIPATKKKGETTSTGLTFAAVLAIVTSLGYLLLVSSLSPKLDFLTSSIWWIIAFLLLVIATTWNTLTNSVFIAHRVTQYALIATLLLGVVRIPLLFLLKFEGKQGILVAQLIGMILCILLCFIFLYARVGYRYKFYISKTKLKNMMSYAFNTYLSNISGGLPALILPTIILKMLGAPSAAYFFIANQFAYVLYVIPSATSQSFFSEGIRNKLEINELIKKSAKIICMFVFPSVILMIVFGSALLSAFGKSYAESGYWMLFFFSITTLPKVASYLFSTVLRINDHIKPVVVVATIGTILQIGASYIGMRISSNLITLGIAALLCEIFVSTSYTILFFYYKNT